LLQGKSKPEYTPHIDTGDHVVIINAEKVAISGTKENDKVYRHHTLYPGGLKEVSYKRMMNNHPERIIELATRRMLPKTKMGKKMFKKLYVYAGAEHPHAAQQPQASALIARSN
jgi:large subunit ribosomal protein L13